MAGQKWMDYRGPLSPAFEVECCHTCAACKMHIALFLIFVVRLPGVITLTDEVRDFGKNVTNLLNALLSPTGYNKNVRPNIGGSPVTVTVNMHIKSIGAISENEEEYTIDLYFRQSWLDSRLKFRLNGVEEMSMSWLFVDKVWKPDTFFMNGKKSSLHKITSANKFMRIRQNGYLTLSMRLTVSASCKMRLKKFPLDTQNCSILIGSYAYTSSDIIYKWATGGEPVATEPGLELAQHDLIGTKTRKRILVKRDAAEYYMIQANFIFQRNVGFFMLQVYVPCSLIIVCSWVSFWINPDDVPARIQLGVIPVLAITTIGFGNRSALPKVSHATALDWFLILCFAFAFGVILEYAYINFVNKIYSDGRKIYEAKKLLAKVVGTITQCSQQIPVDENEEPYGAVTGSHPSKINMEEETLKRDKEKTEKEAQKNDKIAQDFVGTDTEVDVEPKFEKEPNLSDHLVFIDQEEVSIQESPLSNEGRQFGIFTSSRVEGSKTVSSWVERLKTTKIKSLIKKKLHAPIKLWQKVNILPDESDIIRKIEEENPQKFPMIDIKSRVVFPVCFTSSVFLYFISYFYIILDENVDYSQLS